MANISALDALGEPTRRKLFERLRQVTGKQRIIDVGLEIATRVFELTGARASSNSVGLDIYWRNLRTHSLHDPVAYKRVEVGRYALLGDLPTPSAYT